MAVEDPVDMTTAQGRAFATLLAVFGEKEAESIRARVKAARTHLLRSGRVVGGTVPYGWRPVPNAEEPGYILEKDPNRIDYVRGRRSISRHAVGARRYGDRVQKDTEPRFQKGAFDCPRCGAFCQQSWASTEAHEPESGQSFGAGVWLSTCFVCNGRAFWLEEWKIGPGTTYLTGRMIEPVAVLGGPPRAADMPEDVARLYDEASTVVNLSPRSASALLRLALEVLLKDLYPDAGNLNDMIGAAVADGLPKQVQQTMDFMRFNGNQSVHKFHHDDTQETATTLFGLLNIVVERLVTLPKQLDELYDGLPGGFKDQVDRRDKTE